MWIIAILIVVLILAYGWLVKENAYQRGFRDGALWSIESTKTALEELKEEWNREKKKEEDNLCGL